MSTVTQVKPGEDPLTKKTQGITQAKQSEIQAKQSKIQAKQPESFEIEEGEKPGEPGFHKLRSPKEEAQAALGNIASISLLHLLIIIGLAISIIMVIINSIDVHYGISNEINANTTIPADVQQKLNTEFWTIIGISIALIVIGGIIAFAIRHKKSPYFIVPIAMILIGVFGILYGISIKIRTTDPYYKLIASCISTIVFIILIILFHPEAGGYEIRKPYLSTGTSQSDISVVDLPRFF